MPAPPGRMAVRSGWRGSETIEARPKRPCLGSLPLSGLQHDEGPPCTVIAFRPHERGNRGAWDLICLEFRVYAVSSRLKAELRAAPSTLCPPDQEGRVHRYARAYPPAGGVKVMNSRPKAGTTVREEAHESRINYSSFPRRTRDDDEAILLKPHLREGRCVSISGP